MEAVVTTGAISRAELQSNHHQQQTNIQVSGHTETGRACLTARWHKHSSNTLQTGGLADVKTWEQNVLQWSHDIVSQWRATGNAADQDTIISQICWRQRWMVTATDILVLKLISVLVFILFSFYSQWNFTTQRRSRARQGDTNRQNGSRS